MVCAIKISPKLNTDFESPHPRLEIRHKSKQDFTTQRRWRQILYFCMIIAARLIPVDVIWHFMYYIVDRTTQNYKKLFIVKFHQNERKKSHLEMVRFFLRSVYLALGDGGQRSVLWHYPHSTVSLAGLWRMKSRWWCKSGHWCELQLTDPYVFP